MLVYQIDKENQGIQKYYSGRNMLIENDSDFKNNVLFLL